MGRFKDIMNTVLKWEGGYVNNPYDDGGPTNFGITHKVLADWRGVASVTPLEVKQLSKDEAVEIFKHKYWKKIRGVDLPAPIDLIVMDGAVNHGTTNMAKLLQSALSITDDGEIGDKTIQAVQSKTSSEIILLELVIKLAEARKARYVNHPDAQHFLKGWRNRLNDVLATALKPYSMSWTFKDGMNSSSPSSIIELPPVSSVPRSAIDDEDLQMALTKWGFYEGDIDGMFGPKSASALEKLLQKRATDVAGDWKSWSLSRQKIALEQLICQDLDLYAGRIDGLFGQQSQAAAEKFNLKKINLPIYNWRDDLESLPVNGPNVTPSNKIWPVQADVPDFFGTRCAVPMKRLDLPFKVKLAWDVGTVLTGFKIHEKLHDSAARVFEKIYSEYKDDGIEDLGIDMFGGCYNCKKMTGGSAWSMHSWAIAIDFDPGRNQYSWNHLKARLAKPDAKKFWEFWEAEGWLSLGRARDFDWMHVQAARLS